MDWLLAPKRRAYLVTTIIIVTAIYTWSAVYRLSELIEAEVDLPDENSSILRRAEHNIASHLHINASSELCTVAAAVAATAASLLYRHCFIGMIFNCRISRHGWRTAA
jgi:hypothetical protein